MTLCPSCGTNNSDEHNFCAKCGFAIRGEEKNGGEKTKQIVTKPGK